MIRQRCFLIALVMVLALTGMVYAQGPGPLGSDPFWQVSFWNNTTLSGAPVVQGTDAEINFDWGTGAPRPGVNADNFSARWTRYLDLAAGTWRFTATSDDGIRVIVNGQRIIDRWTDHPTQTFTGDIALPAGHHLVVVEYYEHTGGAVAIVTWAPAPPTITNWRGEYFANMTLSGSPALTRDDASIDFDWGAGAPAGGLPADNFSVRWTRTLNFAADHYVFTVTADDGVRLWVNNHLLIDQWRDQPATSYSGTIYVAGDVPLKMEYYEHGGLAVARLSWTRLGGTPPPTPPPPGGTVIVDDTDPGFVRGGAAAGWRTVDEGYNGRMLWTYNNAEVRPYYNWARWYPSLTAGRYEVFVYIPNRYTTTARARYWISHRNGYTLRVIDQTAYADQWVSLGTYTFRGTSADYVSLADVTYETYRTRMIGFDAVKWEPR